jgi:uncharacterized protein YnzC (UPF0291/DUF896 family)
MEEIRRTVEQRYDWVRDFREKRAVIKLDWMYGVIDLEGNEVTPLLYDWVRDFREGRAIVQLNGIYGVIDLEGNEVTPLLYDWVRDFREKKAVVKLDGRKGVIDLDGNVVLPCWYDSVQRQPYGFKATHRVSVHAVEHLYFDLDGHQIAEPITN